MPAKKEYIVVEGVYEPAQENKTETTKGTIVETVIAESCWNRFG